METRLAASGNGGAHRLDHLLVEVIALARALAHPGKHGETACASGDTLTDRTARRRDYLRVPDLARMPPPHVLHLPVCAQHPALFANTSQRHGRKQGRLHAAPWALATLLMSSMMSTVLPTPAPPNSPILPPRW